MFLYYLNLHDVLVNNISLNDCAISILIRQLKRKHYDKCLVKNIIIIIKPQFVNTIYCISNE